MSKNNAKKPKVIFERQGSHLLLDDGKGGLLLEIAVGTISQYMVRMVLTAAEAAQFKAEGEGFIDKLAGQVVYDEPKFRKAGRTVPF